ncbi:MAG: hypothetical protein HC906_13155 [Bacteroidales bacterium]|nr:hypothetical protein [Bacteroidales bacterium]
MSGENFSYTFNKTSGRLTSMNYFGKEILNDSPTLNVWRAPIDNEVDAWTLGQSHLTNRKPGFGYGPSNNWRVLGLDNMTEKAIDFKILSKSDTLITLEVKTKSEGLVLPRHL